MRIAIMGAGSLGTILGAYITRSGREIDLIDVNVEHVDALNNNGAKVIGHMEMVVPVKALTPDKIEGIYDLVFYMTKQTYNKTAFAQLKDHINEDSIVCTLQNGIPEVDVAAEFGEKRTMGAPVGWGATWIGPGVSKLTTEIPDMFFTLGTVSGEITEKVFEVKKILEVMCPVEISTNLMGLRWAKLFINATLSGMSAVLGCTFGEVLNNEESYEIAIRIGKELIEAARAAGVKMEPSHGFDFEEKMYYTDEESKNKAKAAYRVFAAPHKDL
ncbi:MAG: ketopantoate reductase family protein, partial [Youngiibacter sp.]|nr:ketopantoate reductase family protein [Youngiibacter sp.]